MKPEDVEPTRRGIIRELERLEDEEVFEERGPGKLLTKNLVKLFKFAPPKQGKSRQDAMCIGCGQKYQSYKASRLVAHALT